MQAVQVAPDGPVVARVTSRATQTGTHELENVIPTASWMYMCHVVSFGLPPVVIFSEP